MKLLIVSREDGTIVSLTVASAATGARHPSAAYPGLDENQRLDEITIDKKLMDSSLVDIASGYRVERKGDEAELVRLGTSAE